MEVTRDPGDRAEEESSTGTAPGGGAATSGEGEGRKRGQGRRRFVKASAATVVALGAGAYVKPTMRELGVPAALALSTPGIGPPFWVPPRPRRRRQD